MYKFPVEFVSREMNKHKWPKDFCALLPHRYAFVAALSFPACSGLFIYLFIYYLFIYLFKQKKKASMFNNLRS